jgi:hypothetical protein
VVPCTFFLSSAAGETMNRPITHQKRRQKARWKRKKKQETAHTVAGKLRADARTGTSNEDTKVPARKQKQSEAPHCTASHRCLRSSPSSSSGPRTRPSGDPSEIRPTSRPRTDTDCC